MIGGAKYPLSGFVFIGRLPFWQESWHFRTRFPAFRTRLEILVTIHLRWKSARASQARAQARPDYAPTADSPPNDHGQYVSMAIQAVQVPPMPDLICYRSLSSSYFCRQFRHLASVLSLLISNSNICYHYRTSLYNILCAPRYAKKQKSWRRGGREFVLSPCPVTTKKYFRGVFAPYENIQF